jgi:hypothetical protein
MEMLDMQMVEGEVALTVDYAAGRASAIAVLSGATEMIAAIDALDRALLSSVNTSLEPVSILNDVQHSSLKILLARALKSVPDDDLARLDWKEWLGRLLVKGKHMLLQHMDADAPTIAAVIEELKPDYAAAPGLVGYTPPTVTQAQQALKQVRRARALLTDSTVTIQTELGSVRLPDLPAESPEAEPVVAERVVNRGREWLKVRFPDMLGPAQWTVLRGGRNVRVAVLHQEWLDRYHRRGVQLMPGDVLDCDYEETVEYDANQNEIGRSLAIIRVHGVKSPPSQRPLL